MKQNLLQLLLVLLLINSSYQILELQGPKFIEEGNYFENPDDLGDYSISNFGFVPYEQKFTAPVIMGYPFNACTTLQDIKVNKQDRKFILLASATDETCSVVEKVQNAQRAGARMVILVGNDDQHSKQIILNDQDGIGQNINIPSILIGETLGNSMQRAIQSIVQKNKENQDNHPLELLIKVHFKYPKTSELDFKIFVDITNNNELAFIDNLQEKIPILLRQMKFSPVYNIFQCESCRLQGYQESIPNCLGGGKYCALDPDGKGPITGRDLVFETVAQLCVHKFGGNYLWFNYMAEFYEGCVGQKGQLNSQFKNCASKIFEKITATLGDEFKRQVDNCLSDTFDSNISDDITVQPNSLLDQNLKLQQQHKFVQTYPSILINNVHYKGNLYSNNVMQALCSMLEGAPQQCQQYTEYNGDRNEQVGKKEPTDINKNEKADQNNKKITVGWVIFITASVVIVLMILGFLGYRYYEKHYGSGRNSDAKVQELVSQYVKFYETKEKKGKKDSISSRKTNDIELTDKTNNLNETL